MPRSTTDNVLAVLGTVTLLAAGALCVMNLVNDSIPDPRLQWEILYIYLPVLCLLGIFSETGLSQTKYIDTYFRFLNRRFGRGTLYLFIGSLLLDFEDSAEWKNFVIGIALCSVGIFNMVACCMNNGDEPRTVE